MNATFQDLQDNHNRMTGMCVRNEQDLDALLRSFEDRQPFFFELAGENGFTLLIGFGSDIGCVQYSTSDGEPPYLMAIGDESAEDEPFANFLTGNTPTPVPRRFCLPISLLRRIIIDFLESGEQSSTVMWQKI